jgi:hypothetical protein
MQDSAQFHSFQESATNIREFYCSCNTDDPKDCALLGSDDGLAVQRKKTDYFLHSASVAQNSISHQLDCGK